MYIGHIPEIGGLALAGVGSMWTYCDFPFIFWNSCWTGWFNNYVHKNGREEI